MLARVLGNAELILDKEAQEQTHIDILQESLVGVQCCTIFVIPKIEIPVTYPDLQIWF